MAGDWVEVAWAQRSRVGEGWDRKRGQVRARGRDLSSSSSSAFRGLAAEVAGGASAGWVKVSREGLQKEVRLQLHEKCATGERK